MRHNRGSPSRLARIAELQGLRALASEGELAHAQDRRNIAQSALDRSNEAFAQREADVDGLFTGAVLDITALGLGRAVLATLARERNTAAAELELKQAEEEERRGEWNADRALETRAREIHRKARRHVAQKREDAASLEVALLRLAGAEGARS